MRCCLQLLFYFAILLSGSCDVFLQEYRGVTKEQDGNLIGQEGNVGPIASDAGGPGGNAMGQDGNVVEQKPNAASCKLDTECLSTFCVDGVCCDGACSGVCDDCAVRGSEGSCASASYCRSDFCSGVCDQNRVCLVQSCNKTLPYHPTGYYPYIDEGNSTVRDAVTGLTWMKCTAGLSGSDCSEGNEILYTWREAIDYCEQVVLNGHDDWRLPSLNEIKSIYKLDRSFVFMDIDVFPVSETGIMSWTGSIIWSSSVSNTAYLLGELFEGVFYVDFTGHGALEKEGISTDTHAARCVRGGVSDSGPFYVFVDSGERFVLDEATSLVWQGCYTGQFGEFCEHGSARSDDWQDAMDYCEILRWAGYEDWRLPSAAELATIVDYSKCDPALEGPATKEGILVETPSLRLWSSSVETVNSTPWSVRTDKCVEVVRSYQSALFTICVRGGP